jgi:benzoyl-CoA 2,3-epoxidase subunit B
VAGRPPARWRWPRSPGSTPTCGASTFNRKVGAFAGIEATPDGERLTSQEWKRRQGEWLPTAVDKTHVRTLMRPVYERGKIAAWIAPPRNGINGKPFDYDYVHLA